MATHASVPTAAATPPPGPIDPSETFRFPSRDGTELYGEYFAAPTSTVRGAVLVLHGYFEHAGRYRELAHVLTGAGFSALTYDMRGHGRAHGPRGHALRFEQFLEDAEAALAQLDARAGATRPLALVGHSHGGLITLRWLGDPSRRPARLRCAVVSSPFLGLKVKVPAVKRLGAAVLGRVLPTFSMPSDLSIETLTHDAGKLAERRVDTLCHDVAGARWFNEAMAAQAWVREFAPRIDVPTLWLVGGEDLIADPAAARAVHDRLPAGSATWHLLEGQYHEVFNEIDRGRTFELLRAYLVERFTS